MNIVYETYMVNENLVHVKLSNDMIKKLDRLAELECESRSTIIRNALRDYLDKKLLMLGDKHDY